MHLVVGLGNPGARYVDTRHNVGFLVVDALARRAAVSVDRAQHGALTTKAHVAGHAVVLAKPQQFMNLSGVATGRLASFYKVATEEIVVVHDDLEVPFGDVRVKQGGGHGGHNGLRDLHKHVGKDFIRVRVGVSRPPAGWDAANYVLGRFSDDEAAQLQDVVDTAAEAVEVVVSEGPVPAAQRLVARSSA